MSLSLSLSLSLLERISLTRQIYGLLFSSSAAAAAASALAAFACARSRNKKGVVDVSAFRPLSGSTGDDVGDGDMVRPILPNNPVVLVEPPLESGSFDGS